MEIIVIKKNLKSLFLIICKEFHLEKILNIMQNKIEKSIQNANNKNYRGFGRLHSVKNLNPEKAADKNYFYVKILSFSGQPIDLLLTDEEFLNISHRALKNKTDFPPASLWVRFWDYLNK